MDENQIEEPSQIDDSETTEVDPKIAMAGGLIDEAMSMLQQAVRLLGQVPGAATGLAPRVTLPSEDEAEGRVIEGVFDGQQMIGPDGRRYSVPANYASKSKLVEGDMLKLTITNRGAFVYKQVGPIARRRLLGMLTKSLNSGDFTVRAGGQKYKVLTASVTYFRGGEGDEVTILVPENGQSTWAAVENIIKKASGKLMSESSFDQTEYDIDDVTGVE